MWRHWRKGLQENFKKNLCLEKRESFTKCREANHHLCCISKLLSRPFQNIDPSTERKANGDEKSRPNEENTRTINNHTFLEAFGWSGALVFGWVISKQWWRKETWSQDRRPFNHKNIVCHQSLIDILAHVVKTQPPVSFVLPQLALPSENNEVDEFEKAAIELQNVHEKVLGKALNRRGIAYLSRSAGTEAIKYFKRASELNYPPASFNLGQCCELGIGMKQDFKQAAEWYKIASEQGHPTAMYNLGVFYAHGWGGLQPDITVAKELFLKAAELGQPDAKVALDKESSSKLVNKANNPQIPIVHGNLTTQPLKVQSSDMGLFVNKISYELADSVFKKEYGANGNWDVTFKNSVIL